MADDGGHPRDVGTAIFGETATPRASDEPLRDVGKHDGVPGPGAEYAARIRTAWIPGAARADVDRALRDETRRDVRRLNGSEEVAADGSESKTQSEAHEYWTQLRRFGIQPLCRASARSVVHRRAEKLAQLEATAMDPALRGRKANPERVCDLTVGETADVPKDDGFSVLVRELIESGDDALPKVSSQRSRLGEILDPLFRGDILDCGDVHRRESLATRTRQCSVDSDPVEPGEETGVASVVVKVAPGLNERILDHLLDVPGVVEDADEHGAQSIFVATNDLSECVDVALTCEPSELGVGFRTGRHPEIVRL